MGQRRLTILGTWAGSTAFVHAMVHEKIKVQNMIKLNYVASGTYFGCLKEDAEKVAEAVKTEMDYFFNNCPFFMRDNFYKSYEHCLKSTTREIGEQGWKGFYNVFSHLVEQFQPLVDKFPAYSRAPDDVCPSPWLKKAHEDLGRYFGEWEYEVIVVDRASGWTVEIVGCVHDEQ